MVRLDQWLHLARFVLVTDDVTAALRRRVGQRVAELEDVIAERRERLVALARDSATVAPTLADVAPLLDRLPNFATSLDTAPGAIDGLCSTPSLLGVVFPPGDSAIDIDIAVTLYDRGGDSGNVAAPVRAEDWLAPPASHNANLEPLVEGPAISLVARHTKVRREGYAK